MKTVYYCPKCKTGELWAPCPPYCPTHKDVKGRDFVKTYVPDGQTGILDYTLGYTHPELKNK